MWRQSADSFLLCLLALFHGLLLLLGLIKMIETSHVGNKQFKVTYKFPPSFQKRDRDAAKAWAGKLASRESGFDELQHKLATARQAPQYQGVVVGLEEVQPGNKRRKCVTASACSSSRAQAPQPVSGVASSERGGRRRRLRASTGVH